MVLEGVFNYRFIVEIDIWFFGVLLWEIFFFGCRFYDRYSDKEVIEFIREYILFFCLSDCLNMVFVFMKGCWDILFLSRLCFSIIYMYFCVLRFDFNGFVFLVDVSVFGDYFDV